MTKTRALLAACLQLAIICNYGEAAESVFQFSLPKPGLTSAGIFDRSGKLVQVLWTMQPLDTGAFTRSWDGNNQFSQPAADGPFEFRVVVNHATYRNVGAIGNSGMPSDVKNHTPTTILGVAIDHDGAVYTANGWDEAGADFKKWDASGRSIYDANYQIRNGQPNGQPYAIAVDDQYIYCSMGGWAHKPWNEAQQLQRFRRSDGKEEKFTKTGRADGHIQLYEWTSKQLPRGMSQSDPAAELIRTPLRALAVTGQTLYVADSLGNRVAGFDKVSGESISEFPVSQPVALAIDLNGRVWVGHDRKIVSVFSARGDLITTAIKDVESVFSLAFGPNGRLYVTDNGAGAIKIYEVKETNATFIGNFGRKGRPGDRAPDRFYNLRGAAVDANNNLCTVDNQPAGGASLAKWSPDHHLLWEQFGNEFASLGNYGRAHPDWFFSMTFHEYRLLDSDQARWEYVANAAPFATPVYKGDPHGSPRVLHMGDNDFFYFPSGDGVQVYRIDQHVLRLASIFGGKSPAPNGRRDMTDNVRWSWHDADGSGQVRPEQVNYFKQLGTGGYSVFGMDVDQQGNIFFAELGSHAIWEAPVGPLDARGNPTYDWTWTRRVIPRDTSSFGFEPTIVKHADDGNYYAFGWSKPWPAPKKNLFWMGGRTLVKFDDKGERRWAVPLPDTCVGLDVIPGGGGCIVGEGASARLDHYNADGLLVGAVKPGDAMGNRSGWLDTHASVAVNRNPADGKLDIFAEDDLVLRIAWYRVNDADSEVIRGPLTPPAP